VADPVCVERAASEQNGMQKSMLQGTIMHLLRAIIVSFFAAISPTVMADPLSTQPPAAAASGAAESVHVQPRGSAFAPNSAEDKAVQESIALFNEGQRLLDASFNRRLIICRRC
jgi:hypothetical protein